MQQEKARALFAKYGLTLEPEEWISSRNLNVERVEKPIRMRVRRTCHRCQTTFGPDKVCVNCQHVRCKKCARYPPAKSKEQKEQKEAKTKVAAAAAAKQEARPKQQKTKLPVLTIPSRTGGQDLVRKPIKQRVRRYCHRCNNLFIGGATECTQCKHIRCKKCPRDPYVLKEEFFMSSTVTDFILGLNLRNTQTDIRVTRNLRSNHSHAFGRNPDAGLNGTAANVRQYTSMAKVFV